MDRVEVQPRKRADERLAGDNKIRAYLDVFNVFNSRDHDIDCFFYVSRLPNEPPQGVADRHFHPVESRAFRFSVSFAY